MLHIVFGRISHGYKSLKKMVVSGIRSSTNSHKFVLFTHPTCPPNFTRICPQLEISSQTDKQTDRHRQRWRWKHNLSPPFVAEVIKVVFGFPFYPLDLNMDQSPLHCTFLCHREVAWSDRAMYLVETFLSTDILNSLIFIPSWVRVWDVVLIIISIHFSCPLSSMMSPQANFKYLWFCSFP